MLNGFGSFTQSRKERKERKAEKERDLSAIKKIFETSKLLVHPNFVLILPHGIYQSLLL